MPRIRFSALAFALLLTPVGCGSEDAGGAATGGKPLDPDTAPAASVDRFSDAFGKLFKRSAPGFDPAHVSAVIPGPNEPIDMDNFLVRSFGPGGELITYYSLDILPNVPGQGYVVVGADGKPVSGQLPIVDALPGHEGFNDFVRVSEIHVSADYVANTLTSKEDIDAALADGSATMTDTKRIANWAIVPKGTTATRKYMGQTITGFRAWYDHEVASYLSFEQALTPTKDDNVPVAQIVVIFENDESPAMGFAAEKDGQTHNAVDTLPDQAGYSSLWFHQRGGLPGFDNVKDFASAEANVAGPLPVTVNCPVVAP